MLGKIRNRSSDHEQLRPPHGLMRLAFYGIQLLDGFETTRPNVQGRLPELMREAGFSEVRIIRNMATLFGTMTIYAACKQP